MTDPDGSGSGSGDFRLHRAATGKLLFLFILGDVLGAGIYALFGVIAGEVGGAVWAPMLVALVLALLTAASYAELVTRTSGPVVRPGDGGGEGHLRRWQDLPVPTPLVIDTDPGIDDALAILLALASPEVDLRLVTTVHGNVELAQTTDNALRVLHLAGRSDVPVAAGAAASLVHPQPERAGHVHGTTGLGGVQLEPSPAVVDPRPAVVALAELLTTSPEPVTVVAVGPLTNMALLIRVFPEAAARIGRLVIMGGSATLGGNVTAAAEFNVWADAEAAQAVLTSTLPTVLVGLDVTLPTVLDEDGIARFAAAGPVGAQAAAILQQYLDHARAAYGTTGVVVHDALAVTEAVVPGTLTTVRRDVVVDTGLGFGRGQTLVDRRTVSRAPTAVEVAEQVDSATAVEFLVSRLASLDVRPV